MLNLIRGRLTYSNAVATLALFVALGGTSYAVTRDSVGARELAPNSVGASELRTAAVTSRDVRNRAIGLRDISLSARHALRGAAGPAGPPGPSGVAFFAAVHSGNIAVSGNSSRTDQRGVNGVAVYFPRSVDKCGFSATLAQVPGGYFTDPLPGSSITVAPTDDGGVLVKTWNEKNQPTALPFHLIVAC
jgi:hypothetical protein